jgi:DNA repair exonuclease SbcCD ATPase subunit
MSYDGRHAATWSELAAEVERLRFVKDANVEAKEALLEEVERLRKRLVEWEGKEQAARNAQAAEIGRRQKAEAEIERLRAELMKEMNEVVRLRTEVQNNAQAYQDWKRAADERDALQARVESLTRDETMGEFMERLSNAEYQRDALKAALEYAVSGDAGHVSDHFIEQARVAITKVTGETT